MPRKEAESSASARRTDMGRKVLSDSPAFVKPIRKSEKNPPPYGAQHRQDALWEGGNEALPPEWWQFERLDGTTDYQDNSLMTSSRKRPLPGVRLDYPGELVVSGCEWHISPLGRSYFINHDTRTTSWKKPTSERPPGSLTPECIIEGHSKLIWSLACLGVNYNIMSTSEDSSIRQWTRDGEPVGKPWGGDGGGVASMAISPDETMVVCGSADGRLRLWNIKERSMVCNAWEGHNAVVRCLDWSRNALDIVSGSDDGTIRRWNPDTERQMAPSIEASRGRVYAIKYSPQGDKFVSGGEDEMIRVYSKDGELLIEIKGHKNAVMSLCWSKDGAHIFSSSLDRTIRKWRLIDGQELVIFRGHANDVTSISLTPDECHLVSASTDYSVRIWDPKTNQQVGDPLLHDDEVWALAISPDGKYVVSAGLDAKIYVWSLEAALKQQDRDNSDDGNAKPGAKLKGRATRPRDNFDPLLVSRQRANNRGVAKYGNDFWNTDRNRMPHRAASPASPSFPPRWRNIFGSLTFNTPSADVPQATPLQPRHWNFRSPIRMSKQPVDSVVAPCREDDRYGIAPETDEEAAAAMQRPNDNNADSSTTPGQPTVGAQGSQGRPTQQGLTGGAEDIVYEGVSCCGFFFGRRRPASHQA